MRRRSARAPAAGESGRPASRAAARAASPISSASSTAASWVPDLWGRIRRTVESDVASAQASAADLASARLVGAGRSSPADYLQLRIADELKRLLDAAVAAYSRIAAHHPEPVQRRHRLGRRTSRRPRTQLESTRAQAIATGVLRAQLEHAIAVLIGKPPAELTIPPIDAVAADAGDPGRPALGTCSSGGPDIAAAERQMAAANAQIGVAEAAFFPTITLSGELRQSSAATDRQAVHDGEPHLGVRLDPRPRPSSTPARAAPVVEQNRALLDAAIADYRQTVLTAFQQVEDQLAALRILAEQAEAQEAAVAASREAERIIY